MIDSEWYCEMTKITTNTGKEQHGGFLQKLRQTKTAVKRGQGFNGHLSTADNEIKMENKTK